MALVVEYPRPGPEEFPGGLPAVGEPHHCPAFTSPVSVYTDRDGSAWTEHECQVCGESYVVPADLDGLARLVPVAPAPVLAWSTPARVSRPALVLAGGFPPAYRGWW